MNYLDEYSYWEVSYISCEGNERWGIWRAPVDWNEYDVESNIQCWGCGDDPAEIVSVTEYYPEDEWDYGSELYDE